MPKFDEAQKVYDSVLEQLPLGAATDLQNPLRNKASTGVALSRLLLGKMAAIISSVYEAKKNNHEFIDYGPDYQPLTTFFRKNDWSRLYEDLFGYFFTKFFRCGNCSEQARLAIINFLSQTPFSGRAELLQIDVPVQLVGIRDHALLVLNRDPKTPIDRPETWPQGTIIFDTCKKQLFELSETKTLTHSDLVNIAGFKMRELEIHYTILSQYEQPLTADQCQNIVEFFQALKAFFSSPSGEECFRKSAGKTWWTEMTTEQALIALQKSFDEEIQFYQQLKQIQETQNIAGKLAGLGLLSTVQKAAETTKATEPAPTQIVFQS